MTSTLPPERAIGGRFGAFGGRYVGWLLLGAAGQLFATACLLATAQHHRAQGRQGQDSHDCSMEIGTDQGTSDRAGI